MTVILPVPIIYYNVKAYGAKGDGTTDDTTAITSAINAAVAAGGGTIFFPPGTYISGNQTLNASVHFRGAGINASILKLKNAANTDLLSAQTSSISLSASFGTGIVGTLFDFSIQDMTLDGNKANQSGGPSYPLRFYGYGYIMHNLVVRNGYSGGVLSDWNGGSSSPGNDSMESMWSNIKIHDNNGINFQFGGPHDSIFTNIISYNSGSHTFHFAPNSATCQVTNAHAWGAATGVSAVAFLVEALSAFSNCQAEGSDTVQVVLLASGCTWFGGRIFSGSGSNSSGIQFGQAAGNTPYNGQVFQSAGVTTAIALTDCIIESRLKDCDGTHGALWFANDGGWNTIRTHLVTSGTGTLLSTVPQSTTQLYCTIEGITADGSIAKSGQVKLGMNAFSAFTVTNGSHDIFNVNANVGRFEMPNGTFIRMYSDSYTTRTVEISNGTISVLESTTSPDPGNNGTITTSGVGMAKVTPTANETGLILQAGTLAGQEVTVVNQSSSFSITFAASGTSHVALGASMTIAALGKQIFKWDSTNSLWY